MCKICESLYLLATIPIIIVVKRDKGKELKMATNIYDKRRAFKIDSAQATIDYVHGEGYKLVDDGYAISIVDTKSGSEAILFSDTVFDRLHNSTIQLLAAVDHAIERF